MAAIPSRRLRPPQVPPKHTSSHMSPRMPGPITVAPSMGDAYDSSASGRDTITGRTNTSRNRNVPSQTTSITSSGPQQTRRAHSQDAPTNRESSKNFFRGRSKKGSRHADVIDRLDFTSVGPMLHHDGPFDACAPSRNRQRNNAPMFAWSPTDDSFGRGGNVTQTSFFPINPEVEYTEQPKKKVHAMAQAWGIHELEPYEEFCAGGGNGRTPCDTPASSIYNGKESSPSWNANRIKDSHGELNHDHPAAPSDSRQLRGPTRQTLAPPPQPIFVPDSSYTSDSHSPPTSPLYAQPKRSRSLMQRIRRMRDSPNASVHPETTVTTSVSTAPDTRTTHRPQTSLLGRLGGGRSINTPDKPEPFVYIEPSNKDLPATPCLRDSAENVDVDCSTSPGLTRKSSLITKMGRVVGRSRQ